MYEKLLQDRVVLVSGGTLGVGAGIAINLRAPFFLTQVAVKNMLLRRASGTIVNVISRRSMAARPISRRTSQRRPVWPV